MAKSLRKYSLGDVLAYVRMWLLDEMSESLPKVGVSSPAKSYITPYAKFVFIKVIQIICKKKRSI